jgi:hypothetical protein
LLSEKPFGRDLKPGLLIIDELGYPPIDGADLLFKIISRRYERAPMVIATIRVTYAAARRPEWTSVFTAPLRRQGRHRLDGRDPGRDAGYPAPPGQIRTGPIRAYGSHLGW